jgi:hypothetical protein
VIGLEDERVRPSGGEGFADSVTVAFGDPSSEVYGLARLGIVPGESPRVSALAVLCAGGMPVGGVAQGQIEAPAPDWTELEAAGVRMQTVEPLESWSVGFAAEEAGFEVRLSALTPPIETEAGGLQGYDQLCRVQGSATVGGSVRAVDGLGQRSHAWGVADWERMESVRTIGAWLGEDRAVGLQAVRAPDADGHENDAVSAWLLGEEGPAPLAEARLSTSYDDEGRQRRAGLELWESEESEYPHRMAGEVVCGSTLDLGALRLDTAFFRFRMEGREGAGRYDVLRKA